MMVCQNRPDSDERAWTHAGSTLPADGLYECMIQNKGREFIAVRRLKGGHWFGGCRPFSDADVVLAWREKED
jgi:hypothetical protein